MKTCTKCGEQKEHAEFYYDLRGGKLSSWCRVCTRQYTLDWRARHPERRRAHVLVAWALKYKKLRRPKACSRCKKTGTVVAHHEDYHQPLKVMWVCDSCHVRRHIELGRKAPSRRKGD